MSGDTSIRRLTVAAVLLVAVIAAVVGFIHIEDLAVTHGQTRLAAALLLPVSVDGTVAGASLSMLGGAERPVDTLAGALHAHPRSAGHPRREHQLRRSLRSVRRAAERMASRSVRRLGRDGALHGPAR